MIKPTIGRVVWYHGGDRSYANYQPQAALVAYVHDDVSVNLSVISRTGTTYGIVRVPLWQGEGTQPTTEHCEWMPYQKGQAAKAEQLEAASKP